ncbi:MAG: Hsp70 family protein, partial [Planctomycetes bacterium]|nr:Hsp70 family protein [Planctomycetota bacterium]
MRAKPGRFVGIDLGTTFSAVAFVDAQGKPITIKNRDGQAVTPSAVMIQPDR